MAVLFFAFEVFALLITLMLIGLPIAIGVAVWQVWRERKES